MKNRIKSEAKLLWSTQAQSQNNKRDLSLDIARGIAIILVVIGHSTYIPPTINIGISTFHLPAFFVISGWLMFQKQEYTLPFKKIVTSKVRSIFIPYIWFSLFTLLVDLLQVLRGKFTLDLLIGHTIQTTILEGYSVLWFLPVLYLAAVIAFFAFFMGKYAVQENAERAEQHAVFEALEENTDALLAHVPQDEHLEILGYRTEPKWYVAAKAMPYLKYYFLQEILGQADPIVMDEIVEALNNDPPKWLVIFYNRPFGPPYDERVQEIFASQYEFVDARGEYQLLKLKDE